MANKDQTVGFSPYGRPLRQQEYIASETIYPGDLVKLEAAGRVARCAASDASCGVAASYASGAGVKLNVLDDPDQLFECQADDATIDAQTDINLNYDIVVGSPNTAYKRSGMQVDASTQATTATLPIKVLSISKRIDNELGSKVDVVCQINNHQLSAGTGTAGV